MCISINYKVAPVNWDGCLAEVDNLTRFFLEQRWEELRHSDKILSYLSVQATWIYSEKKVGKADGSGSDFNHTGVEYLKDLSHDPRVSGPSQGVCTTHGPIVIVNEHGTAWQLNMLLLFRNSETFLFPVHLVDYSISLRLIAGKGAFFGRPTVNEMMVLAHWVPDEPHLSFLRIKYLQRTFEQINTRIYIYIMHTYSACLTLTCDLIHLMVHLCFTTCYPRHRTNRSQK